MLNNQQITEEIKKEIKICIETNENENTTTQNLWDTGKTIALTRRTFLGKVMSLIVELGYLFHFFSCFLMYACIAMSLSLITAFTVSHRFWVVVLSFSFVSIHILISFLISSVICCLFISVLFSLNILEF